MRNKTHKLVDWTFDLPKNIQMFILFKIANPIKCYCRKPKYRIGELTHYYNHYIVGIYKNYRDDIIYYKLNGCDLTVSEGVLIFYEEKYYDL